MSSRNGENFTRVSRHKSLYRERQDEDLPQPVTKANVFTLPGIAAGISRNSVVVDSNPIKTLKDPPRLSSLAKDQFQLKPLVTELSPRGQI